MRLEQLKFFCAIVDQGFSVSRAADVLHISQPAVSKQIANLEVELGVDLLVRAGGRIVGLTSAGQSTLTRARQILAEIDDLIQFGKGLSSESSGRLVIATTHTYARYCLLDVIKDFRQRYPQVHLHLVQANPSQVVDAIVAGTADIGISSEGKIGIGLRKFRGRDLGRSIMAPADHPIFREKSIGLEQLGRYSLLTLDFSFPGGRAVGEAFKKAGIEPNIVMTATDPDVIKAYLRLGLGIAVLPTIAFDRSIDRPLEAADVTHLFGVAPSIVLIRPEKRIPGYMADFIQRIAPS